MTYDLIIVGGGLVGASLAAALRHSGLNLALVEAQPAPTLDVPGWDSRIYAFDPASRRYLQDIGAWSQVDMTRTAPVAEMRVFGDTGAELLFSAYEMGVPELAVIAENRLIQHALWQTIAEQDNLTLFHPARCASLQFGDEAATLTLSDGRGLSGKLVVGADGRDSWVRAQAGLNGTPLDYQHHGVVANFRCTRPHRNIAWQWFQPGRILALLPLPDNQLSMVWSVPPDESARLTALSGDELCAEVAAAAQGTLGELSLVTPAVAFPLRLLVLPQISAPRVALIGDAAHNMHPLAGQGVNTGFRDARQLAKILLERGGQTDCGDAQLMRRYTRQRKEDIYSMQGATYALKTLFGNEQPQLTWLRNSGMHATNQLAPLKKLLMAHLVDKKI